MAQPSRLAGLPGYDTSPDIYETAETDDASTTHTSQTSPRSPSETDETTDEEDGDESYGVSRRRLYPERARQHFTDGARNVDAKGVDLSDRIDRKRKGYGMRRRRAGGPDEDEGLEAKIARLRREIEECKAEAEKEQAEAEEDGEGGEAAGQVDGLAKLLANIEAPTASRSRPRATNGAAKGPPAPPEPDEEEDDEQILARVADFDTRLSALEQALGLSSLDAAATGSGAVSSPLIPSLTILDQQLSALSSASSLSGLEAARSRVQKLRSEADDARADDDEESTSISADDLEKLQSLYQLIPTLSSLAPTVPALLSRLRSLRTLHTTAASAGSDLDEIERRQREMETDLKEWREGLERVDAMVKKAGTNNSKNADVIEEWVDELKERVEKLGP